MGIFRSIRGMVALEIVSADIPGMLAAVSELNIPVFSVRTKGELAIQIVIYRSDLRAVSALCGKRGEVLRVLSRKGVYWVLRGLLSRPLLLGGMAVLMLLTLFLPTRVLFVRVEGNASVPTRLILEAAEESGICFGASRLEVRSERMKNALLEALPQLQWAGVNTSGCTAVISVRERSAGEEAQEESGVSSIVAACDGLILSTTVTRGSGLCRPGQAVTKGQVLISGYTDLGLCIRATRAEGEIFARTRRTVSAMTPSTALQRGEETSATVKYSLILGKKRINLWKGSGIWEGSCGRMYEEYYITLPGGFRLPIAIVKETAVRFETSPVTVAPGSAEAMLGEFSEAYLRSQMISGTVESSELSFIQNAGVYVLEGEYLCTEMIGRQRQEKIGE